MWVVLYGLTCKKCYLCLITPKLKVDHLRLLLKLILLFACICTDERWRCLYCEHCCCLDTTHSTSHRFTAHQHRIPLQSGLAFSISYFFGYLLLLELCLFIRWVKPTLQNPFINNRLYCKAELSVGWVPPTILLQITNFITMSYCIKWTCRLG